MFKLTLTPPLEKPIIIYSRKSMRILQAAGIDRHAYLVVDRDETKHPATWKTIAFIPYYFLKVFRGIPFREALFLAYYCALLKSTDAKIGLTTVDNDQWQQSVGRFVKGISWIAVQNGIRTDVDYASKKQCTPFHHYVCLGNYTRFVQAKHGFHAEHYHAYGSMLASAFKANQATRNTPDLDICFVSEFKSIIADGHVSKRMARSIMQDIIRLHDEHPELRIAVACRAADDREHDFYRDQIGDRDIDVVRKTDDVFHVYRLMDRSRLCLGSSSTALYEAFGWGSKVLFINRSEYDDRHAHGFLPELCYTEAQGYQALRDHIFFLLQMDQDAFNTQTAESRRELCSWNPERPGHKRLFQLIDRLLSE